MTASAPAREVLSVSQVARMFGVDPKTVTRWAKNGKLPHFRTLGGHRRFYRDEIEPLLVEVVVTS